MKRNGPGRPAFVDVNLVIGLVAEQLHVSPSDLAPNRRFIEDLGASEVDVTNMLLALEVEFQLQIGGDEALECCTLADVLRYVDAAVDHAATRRDGSS